MQCAAGGPNRELLRICLMQPKKTLTNQTPRRGISWQKIRGTKNTCVY